jgi:orotidine-5'-phosphate decarboxylase
VGSPRRSFGDELTQRVLERESQLVLGLDPHPSALWPVSERAAGAGDGDGAGDGAASLIDSRAASSGSPAERAAAAVLDHCRALIDAVAPACVAIKPQLACFERLGTPGWGALRAVVEHAHACGLLVLADGKRGDISVTAEAYGQALFGGIDTPFGQVEGLGADMATVNPLMGRDAIEPFVAAARAGGGGVLVLVRTSNPGAADVEDLRLTGERGGAGDDADATDDANARPQTVWERVALLVEELGRAGVEETGLSDVGAVVGATEPKHLARARALMPHAVFLLPGVGAQGGRVEELAPAFAPGRAGGLITASRSIASAHQASGGDHASAARAEAERLRAAAWALPFGS